MRTQKKHPVIYTITAMAVLGMRSLSSGAEPGPNKTEAELPGYYEFFMKAGKLSQLKPEVTRDEKIRAGELKPVYGNAPVLDLQLPDGFGQYHGTRDQVGRKHLVLITGRAWW